MCGTTDKNANDILEILVSVVKSFSFIVDNQGCEFKQGNNHYLFLTFKVFE